MPILTQYTQPAPSTTGNPHPALPFYPNSFSESQALKAIKALVAHHAKHREEKEGSQLVLKDEHVWLTIALKEVPKSKRWSAKPVRITVPFPPLPPPPATTVALITKPPQRQYKDLIFSGIPLPVDPSSSKSSSSTTTPPNQGPIKFITRVLDTTKLRGKHAPYEARRALCNEYDLWLCDERILPSLGKLLGKTWLDAKKQPVPVNLGRKDLKGELGRAVGSAVFVGSKGTANALRIATPSYHSPDQILQNLLTAIPQVMHLIPNGWNNVLSLGIKTSGSVMLPIWRCELGVRYEEWRERPEGKEVERKVRKLVKGEKEVEDEIMEGSDDGEDEQALSANSIKSSKKGKQPETPSVTVSTPVVPASKSATTTTSTPKKVIAGKSKTDASSTDKKRKSSSLKSVGVKQKLIGKAGAGPGVRGRK